MWAFFCALVAGYVVVSWVAWRVGWVVSCIYRSIYNKVSVWSRFYFFFVFCFSCVLGGFSVDGFGVGVFVFVIDGMRESCFLDSGRWSSSG